MGLVRLVVVAVAVALLPLAVSAQEMLVPVATCAGRVPVVKSPGDTLGLPFFDDFSDRTGIPNPALWEPGGAIVEDASALLPPTVGVLTLDAYDAEGMLYEQATISTFAADTIVSRPFRLDTLAEADSVVFSFFYLPGGGSGNMWERVGDSPEKDDSLVLDFYYGGQWNRAWYREGVRVDSLVDATGRSWQYVALKLGQACLTSDFRFRFRNYCSIEVDSKNGRALGGDQWHIDYVVLDRGRSTSADYSFRDVAFGAPATSLLKYYYAMPGRQFRDSEAVDRMDVKIVNLYNSEMATHYGYVIYKRDGDTAYAYDGGYQNAPVGDYQTNPSHARPQLGYHLLPREAPYVVEHVVREGAVGDEYGANDTVRFVQQLDNYYAYDDGTAENGYGITSTATRLYFACRFDLNEPDTLSSVAMFFNRTYQSQNEEVQFFISVWEADASGKPSVLLYRDVNARTPVVGSYEQYVLEHEVKVPQGQIFVGLEQVGNTYINIGFDRSRNSSDRIYYLTSTEWQHSILSGSLMLRPYFGDLGPMTGIVEKDVCAQTVAVAPNPASTVARVMHVPDGAAIEVMDIVGRCVMKTNDPLLDVSRLPEGMYMLRIVSDTRVPTVKLIVSR